MTIPFPRDMRALFEAFRLYDPAAGIASVLDAIDFTGVAPRHVYYCAHGRLPEKPGNAVARPDYNPKAHLRIAIESDEFRANFLRLFLQAFPEQQRLIFIHVPKCAGTHLNARLSAHYRTLAATLGDQAWSPQPALFAALHRVVVDAERSGDIFVTGHTPLTWYIDRGLIRPVDQLFSVVRDPLDLVLSNVNYILARFAADPGFSDPDTRLWAQTLGILGRPFDPSPAAINRLAGQILHDRHLTGRNFLCRFLGAGTAASAIDLVVCTNLEITDVTRYNEWFARKWGIPVGDKENVADKSIDLAEFRRANLAYLEEITAEDRCLYECIERALHTAGTAAIFGEALAR